MGGFPPFTLTSPPKMKGEIGMTHIVTGGAGFIGSHLVDRLCAADDVVRVIDNFERGTLFNLQKAIRTGNMHFHRVDLSKERIPMSRLDVVWHLAAKVRGIEYNRFNQYDMLVKNLAINYNVIESVRRQQPRLFVYVSTACVYPHDAPVPTPESAGDIGNPEPTNHGYGVAKWVGEQMVKHLIKEHNQKCLIVRFFNAFGERDYYDNESSHVAPALIRRVMEGENPVVVWGTGDQTRALVDARDIAKALELLSATEQAQGKIVNIGHERDISIRELAETIVRLSGRDVELKFDTSKPDGYPRRAADTTLLRELIGWVPDTPLEDTLGRMIAEFERGEAHT